MKRQYTSYQQTIDFLTAAEQQFPELIRTETIGTTWENRPIIMATISDKVTDADKKPALLYTGSIHAREWIGHELATKFIKHIIDNYQYDPSFYRDICENTLYIIPCVNPDGFEYSRTHFSFWRKNRRDNGDGSFGVDLNRNFSEGFKKSNNTSSATFGGHYPFSEPETKAIKSVVENHKNITIALDYHSQGNVFFPAHKFNHESEIEGTDLNVLCANMKRQIKKVTGREYGIDRGKPPVNLIYGSGREYYYSKGIISTVVEVGTRNIPDYLQNMTQSIDENIPAIKYALSEVKNYSNKAPNRVTNFTIKQITHNSVTLVWDYDKNNNVYFEIYRSENYKSACSEGSRIAITHSYQLIDRQLKSGQRYFYNIRAVKRSGEIKSPFSPELILKTKLAADEFSRALFPIRKDIGYIQNTTMEKNLTHFGHNSLFIGVSTDKGICYGVIAFSLSHLTEDIHIKSAVFRLYPINRVAAKIEKYGEWSISILDPNEITNIADFNQIDKAKPIHTLGYTIKSDKLAQGIWTEWHFNGIECALLRHHIKDGRVLFRIQGPTDLPLGNTSQLMQFDIGYGRFGGGLHYRPSLEIIYNVPSIKVELKPKNLNSISSIKVSADKLKAGVDKMGNVVYGQIGFTLEQLPDPQKTVITVAYLLMRNKNSIDTNEDIRFTIELVELRDIDYASVKQRQKIEFIGYEVSNQTLKKKKRHHFIFDSYCRQILEDLHAQNKPVYFIIRATSACCESKALINWYSINDEKQPLLVIKYINRLKQEPHAPQEFKARIEGGKIKLLWTNSESPELVGSYVVRNRFHPPKSPFDGVKLYAGKDNYTFDYYGNSKISKYYSVFHYDNVPNYSLATSLFYDADEEKDAGSVSQFSLVDDCNNHFDDCTNHKQLLEENIIDNEELD